MTMTKDEDTNNDNKGWMYDHYQSSLEPLLVRRNYFLVLDLGLDNVNGVRCLGVQGGGLACERVDEDLHASAEAQHKVECGLLLHVVVRHQRADILKLLVH